MIACPIRRELQALISAEKNACADNWQATTQINATRPIIFYSIGLSQ